MQSKWRNCIQSAKTRPGVDCGSANQLLIAKFRLKLKKTMKNSRSARYDLNQIPYAFTIEVANRFKGLDLEELWTQFCNIIQEMANKTIPNKKARRLYK